MKQTWEQMAEELRMEIEQWQNPIFETIMGPLPKSIIDKAQEDELKEAEDLLIENPYQVLNENITEQIEEEFKVKFNETDDKP